VIEELRAMLTPFYSRHDVELFIERFKEFMGERNHQDIDETIREFERINITFEIGELLAETLKAIFTPPVVPKPEEIKIMANFVLKDDNPPVGLKFDLGVVKDAEGNVIENSTVVVETVSSDENVVAFAKNVDDSNGEVSFGSPGSATLQYTAKDPATGKVLGTGSDGFTLTTGDPDSISGITANFDGLTPVDEAPPVV
jgi:hypothetical protein